MQKKARDLFVKQLDEIRKSDRLELILATRAAFQHMIRTLKAFDNWLQDPLIVSHMPKEMLEEVWITAVKILSELLDLDIKHTSSFMEHLKKLEDEGKLNPLLVSDLMPRESRSRRGEEISLSM